MKNNTSNRFNLVNENLDYANDQLTDQGFSELPAAIKEDSNEKLMIVDNHNKSFWLIGSSGKSFTSALAKNLYDEELVTLHSDQCAA